MNTCGSDIHKICCVCVYIDLLGCLPTREYGEIIAHTILTEGNADRAHDQLQFNYRNAGDASKEVNHIISLLFANYSPNDMRLFAWD